MWKAARKAGFSEAESLVIATSFYDNGYGQLYLQQYNHGHFPLDAVDDAWNVIRGPFMNSVSRLENADPIVATGKWKDSAKPNPINACWSEQARRPIKYFDQLNVKVQDKPAYAGKFQKYLTQEMLDAHLKIELVQGGKHEANKPMDFKTLFETRHEWRV